MKRPKVAPYTRYYLYDSFKSIDKEFFNFFKAHEKELSQEQKDLIENLINLSQNLKRLFRFTETHEYPWLIERLTLDKLQEYTKEITNKRRSLKPPYEVTFLTTNYYLEMAKKVESEAQDYLNKI